MSTIFFSLIILSCLNLGKFEKVTYNDFKLIRVNLNTLEHTKLVNELELADTEVCFDLFFGTNFCLELIKKSPFEYYLIDIESVLKVLNCVQSGYNKNYKDLNQVYYVFVYFLKFDLWNVDRGEQKTADVLLSPDAFKKYTQLFDNLNMRYETIEINIQKQNFLNRKTES